MNLRTLSRTSEAMEGPSLTPPLGTGRRGAPKKFAVKRTPGSEDEKVLVVVVVLSLFSLCCMLWCMLSCMLSVRVDPFVS